MRDRKPLDVVADYLAVAENDAVIGRALGLIAGGAMVLLYAAHRLTRVGA